VAGAIFSGFGMVLTLLLPLRVVCKLQDVITVRHVELMGKVVLATGSMVGYAYGMEFFIAWYSGNPYERFAFMRNRAADPFILGPLWGVEPAPYWWAYWSMITCNVVCPQLFWFKKVRTNMTIVFIISIFVNIGMWFERFVIIVTSLHRDYIPSIWAYFRPTWVDVWQFIGTFGLFLTLFLLFMRYLPMIAISEVKGVTPQADPHHPLGGAKAGGHH
jgi:molybdopterin-containing oxidoreductase family membrane subunit